VVATAAVEREVVERGAAEAAVTTVAVVVAKSIEMSHLQTAGCDQYRCRCPSM